MQIVAEAGFRHIPAAIFAELTRRCNLRCKHCYLTDYDGEDELNTREWLGVLDEVAALGGVILTISGGEPLLRDDLEEIAAHAVELGYFTRLFTNGTLIDAERVKSLAKVHWQAVEVSLHGATPQSHDALTGTPGSFKQTLAAMNLLKAAGITLTMKGIFNKLNLHEVADMVKMAKELGANIRFSPLITVKEDGGIAPLACRLDEEDLQEALMAMRLAAEVEPTEPELFTDGENLGAGTTLSCSAGRGSAEIHANGDVSPCVALPFVLGNIRLQNFGAIWYNSSRVERLLQLGGHGIPECMQCEYSVYCARCPGSSLGESGSMMLPGVDECRVARANWKVADTLWRKKNI